MADALAPADRTRLDAAVAATRFTDVRWVAETGSTNADLLAEAGAGPAADVVLVADHQGAGRGRLDRTWEAPPGSSLLVSVLLRSALAPDELHLISTAVGVAAVEAVRAVGVPASLKWPNDLVVDTAEGVRKLAGILAEARLQGTTVEAVVVGIGINVNWPQPLPEDLAQIAVAANQVVGHDVDRVALLGAFLVALDAELAHLATGPGRATLLTRYRDRCATLGATVRVELADETFEGRAVRVDDAGHLVVEVPGEPDERVVAAGDVVHVRAAG